MVSTTKQPFEITSTRLKSQVEDETSSVDEHKIEKTRLKVLNWIPEKFPDHNNIITIKVSRPEPALKQTRICVPLLFASSVAGPCEYRPEKREIKFAVSTLNYSGRGKWIYSLVRNYFGAVLN